MGCVSLIDGHIENAEHCVCCGKMIPEGSQYCIVCGYKAKQEPKIDLVNVVRCKDCKHWDKQGFDPLFDVDFGNCKRGHLEKEFYSQTDETDFCSYGERKEK